MKKMKKDDKLQWTKIKLFKWIIMILYELASAVTDSYRASDKFLLCR